MRSQECGLFFNKPITSSPISPPDRQTIQKAPGTSFMANAELAFRSDPDGAEVCSTVFTLSPAGLAAGGVRANVPTCRTAPFVLWVPAGQHVLQVRSPGLDERATPLEVVAGKHQDIALTLRARVAVGRLDIFSPVDGAEVTIDGEPGGKTPLSDLRLPAGTHRVRVGATEGKAWESMVEVSAGDTTTVFAEQTPTRPLGEPGSGLAIPPAPPAIVATARTLTIRARG